MERYKILYRILVKHDYFNEKPCTVLQCNLTLQGALLAKGRGLLLRKNTPNEWVIIYDSNADRINIENDVLELEISITDPAFMLYTEWPDFRPDASYMLELPAVEDTINIVSTIRQSDKKQKAGKSLCTLCLRLTEELLETAKINKPKQAVLHFYTPKVQWEYLFIPRTYCGTDIKQLQLKDLTGKLTFSDFESFDIYGQITQRTISSERIPMQYTYENRLQLVVRANNDNDDKQQKRILLSYVDLPTPGRYLSETPGIIRQICYY